MGKNTTTTNASTTSANPQAAQDYTSLLNQAQGVAATPYQAYTGELTAPVNSQQQTGIGGINAASGQAQPAVNQALGIAGAAANPLTQQQIQQYQNPYTQDVVNATQAQFNNQNAQQQQSLTGNAIAQGALGGNRTGVAAANLAGQQSLAQAPVIAGLYSNSYNQGLATANQQFQTNPLAAAGSIANFGISGQGAALSGAGAQLGAGTLEQQTQQATDTANQQAYAQQQAYPFQTAQWLAGIDTGVGSALGSSSTGQTTAPAPNQAAQYAGLGLAAASFLARGGRVGYADGGPVQHMGVGGTPWSNAPSWVPTFSGVHSAGLHAGSAPSAQSPAAPSFDYGKIVSANNKDSSTGLIDQYFGSNPIPAGASVPDAYGATSVGGAPLNAMYARGGVVGYAEGGAPAIDFGDPGWDSPDIGPGIGPAMFADRFAPANDSPLGPMTRGQGIALASKGQPDIAPANDTAATYDDGQGPVRMYGQRPEGNTAPVGAPPVAAKDDDDDEVPANATPTSGAALASAAYKPPYDIGPADYAKPADRGSGLPNLGILPISSNARSGLLAAGLGMLASRSSNFGNAVGEGGLHGLTAYSAAEDRDRKVADEAQKLSLEAKKTANELAHQTFTTNESARHNQATEAQAKVNADRTKFMPAGSAMTADGAIHPLVMDQSTGKMIDAVTRQPPTASDKTMAKGEKAPLSDDDAKAVAQRYVRTGDRTQLQGLGMSGAARQKVNHYIGEVQKEEGISDQDLGTRVAEWEGRKAGQRVLGTQEAKMGSAAFEAEGAMKLARGTIDKVPRTSYLPLNKLIQGYQTQTLNPDQAELYGRAQAIVNTYSAVMARGANITTDASRGHAEALLNTAGDHDTWNRMLDTLQSEIDMAKGSPERMREFYRKQFGAKAVVPEGTQPGAAAQPGATVATPQTKVINGTTYVNRNGQWFAQ